MLAHGDEIQTGMVTTNMIFQICHLQESRFFVVSFFPALPKTGEENKFPTKLTISQAVTRFSCSGTFVHEGNVAS